ncbi:hypothetical protein [Arthrobacter sp. MMS24-S77]
MTRFGARARRKYRVVDVQYSTQDWSAIRVGESVEVQLATRFSYHGSVEAKTADSKIVWVVSSSGQGRAMYTHADGVRIATVEA